MKRRVSVENFFEQVGNGGCGLCVVNTILKMFGKRGLIFSFSPEKGISPKRILHELRKADLIVVSKTISIRNLKPLSILWYPPRGKNEGDHYVVASKVKNKKVFIFDSEKKEPYWERFPVLQKKWYRWYKGRWCGWVIEVKGGKNGI